MIDIVKREYEKLKWKTIRRLTFKDGFFNGSESNGVSAVGNYIRKDMKV